MISLSRVCEQLKSGNDYLILMHASPDGDTIGSATALCLALQKMGKRVKCRCADTIDSKYLYMFNDIKTQDFEEKCVISVDVADTKLLGKLKEEYEDRIDINIDHHISNKMFAKVNYVVGESGANCENIYDIIKGLNAEIDGNIANCLYTGISTDTGCFKYSNTTARTFRIAADLLDLGADTAYINRILFETKSKARIEVEKQALENMEFHCRDKVALILITDKMQEKATLSDLEGITAMPRTVEDVLIGITLKHKGENLYKVSVRTFEPIDASAICSNFGGGGHSAAAGCEMHGSLDEVKLRLLEVCKKELEK